jgi:hypothetical protein
VDAGPVSGSICVISWFKGRKKASEETGRAKTWARKKLRAEKIPSLVDERALFVLACLGMLMVQPARTCRNARIQPLMNPGLLPIWYPPILIGLHDVQVLISRNLAQHNISKPTPPDRQARGCTVVQTGHVRSWIDRVGRNETARSFAS